MNIDPVSINMLDIKSSLFNEKKKILKIETGDLLNPIEIECRQWKKKHDVTLSSVEIGDQKYLVKIADLNRFHLGGADNEVGLEKKIQSILTERKKIYNRLLNAKVGDSDNSNKFYADSLTKFIIDNLLDETFNLIKDKKTLTHLGFKIDVLSDGKMVLIFPFGSDERLKGIEKKPCHQSKMAMDLETGELFVLTEVDISSLAFSKLPDKAPENLEEAFNLIKDEIIGDVEKLGKVTYESRAVRLPEGMKRYHSSQDLVGLKAVVIAPYKP